MRIYTLSLRVIVVLALSIFLAFFCIIWNNGIWETVTTDFTRDLDYKDSLTDREIIFTTAPFTSKANLFSLSSLPVQPTLTVNDLPSHCIIEKKTCTDNESLPEFVFVAGIEGSGHHMIKVLFDFPEESSIRRPYIIEEYVPNLHLMDPAWIESSEQMGFAIIHENLFRQRLTPFLDKMNQAKKEGRRGLLVYVHSFPMGLSVLSTARPDLLVLKYFDCILYRLKVIVMKRHPLPALISTLRRFGSDRYRNINSSIFTIALKKAVPPADYPYIMQARIVEDQLIYLDQQIRRLGCSQVYIFDFNSVFSPRTRWRELKALSMFIGLGDLETDAVIAAKLKPPTTELALPPTCTKCTRRVLYDFFEDRKVMWPLLAV